MFTRIALIAAAAVIFLTSASASFAAPKSPTPEPDYFKYATGAEWWKI